MKIRLGSFIFVALLTALAPSRAPAASKAKPRAQASEPSVAGTLVPLAQVVSRDLNGLSTETPATLEELQSAVGQFAAAKKSRGYSPEKFALLRRCVIEERASPLCRYLLRTDRRARAPSLRASRAEQRRLVKAFRARDIAALSSVPESSLIDALKAFHEFDKLRPVADRALADTACSSPALLTALGMKAERELPKPEFKDLTKKLYARAIDCASIGSAAGPEPVGAYKEYGAARAAYRLGLLQIWDKAPVEAERTLARVTDDELQGEYDSRALYWRLKLARAAGNSKVALELKNRLVAEFPLTLHALLVEAENGRLKPPSYVSGEDPLVGFRSRIKPELNPLIAAVELLQASQEFRVALDLLEASTDDFKDAEREVRLYSAVLLRRSGDSLKSFQVLTSLFKENSSLMSRGSLELFYPRTAFESVAKACGDHLDPYLMLSLIRQESAFNERAHSGAGAIGLMQVMPRTGQLMSRVSRTQLFNPDVNVQVGVKYFSRLLERFGGSVELSLAAYNAGPERVDEWSERYPVKDRMLFVDLMPFRETREYVASIARNYYWYLNLYNKAALEPVIKGSQERAIASDSSAPMQPFLFDFLSE